MYHLRIRILTVVTQGLGSSTMSQILAVHVLWQAAVITASFDKDSKSKACGMLTVENSQVTGFNHDIHGEETVTHREGQDLSNFPS